MRRISGNIAVVGGRTATNRQAHAAGVEFILAGRDQGRLAAAFDEFGASPPSNGRDRLVEIHPGAPVVAEISGEIDIASASWLRETLLLAIQRHGPVIYADLRGVTFLDCSGVSVLIATARRAQLEGGWMRVTRPSAPARRVILLLRLQHLLAASEQAGAAAPRSGHAARSARGRTENAEPAVQLPRSP